MKLTWEVVLWNQFEMCWSKIFQSHNILHQTDQTWIAPIKNRALFCYYFIHLNVNWKQHLTQIFLKNICRYQNAFEMLIWAHELLPLIQQGPLIPQYYGLLKELTVNTKLHQLMKYFLTISIFCRRKKEWRVVSNFAVTGL